MRVTTSEMAMRKRRKEKKEGKEEREEEEMNKEGGGGEEGTKQCQSFCSSLWTKGYSEITFVCMDWAFRT